MASPAIVLEQDSPRSFERSIDVKAAAQFLGVSPSLVYAYVERKQIPHFRMMGRSIRFRLSELDRWRQQFYVKRNDSDIWQVRYKDQKGEMIRESAATTDREQAERFLRDRLDARDALKSLRPVFGGRPYRISLPKGSKTI